MLSIENVAGWLLFMILKEGRVGEAVGRIRRGSNNGRESRGGNGRERRGNNGRDKEGGGARIESQRQQSALETNWNIKYLAVLRWDMRWGLFSNTRIKWGLEWDGIIIGWNGTFQSNKFSVGITFLSRFWDSLTRIGTPNLSTFKLDLNSLQSCYKIRGISTLFLIKTKATPVVFNLILRLSLEFLNYKTCFTWGFSTTAVLSSSPFPLSSLLLYPSSSTIILSYSPHLPFFIATLFFPFPHFS